MLGFACSLEVLMPILLKKKKEKNPQKTQSSDSQPGRGLLLLALGQGLWTAASQPAASVLCSCPHSTRFSATHTLLGKPLDSGGGGDPRGWAGLCAAGTAAVKTGGRSRQGQRTSQTSHCPLEGNPQPRKEDTVHIPYSLGWLKVHMQRVVPIELHGPRYKF